MKKGIIFTLCTAVLCTGLIFGTVTLASAQQEGSEYSETQASPLENPEADGTPVSEGEATTETKEPGEGESSAPEPVPAPDGEATPGEEPAPETEEPGDGKLPPKDSGDGMAPKPAPEPTPIPGIADITNVAAAMKSAHDSLDAHISRIASLLDISDDYVPDQGEDNFFDALAIYAIRHDQTDNFPYNIELTDATDYVELASIYWSLNTVNAAKTEDAVLIRVTRSSPRKALTDAEQALFETLDTPENRAKVQALSENAAPKEQMPAQEQTPAAEPALPKEQEASDE